MARFCVSGVYKGERVYVTAPVEWPSMRALLRFSITPTPMGEAAAQRLATYAERVSTNSEPCERLTDIRVESEEAR